MAQFIFPAVSVDTTGLATEAKQDLIISELVDVNTELDTISSTVATEATQATLATEATAATLATEATAATLATETTATTIAGDTTSIDAKTPSLGAATTAASTPVNIASDQTVPVSAASLPLPTGAATETTLDSFSAKTKSADVTEAHDYKAYTYVAAGNGAGQVETITYKSGGAGGTTVATQTFTYDASDRVASITKS